MFRFVSTNATQGLKPVILQNLRNNTGIIQPATLNNKFNSNSQKVYHPKIRNYTTKISTRQPEKYDEYIEKYQEDPLISQAVKDDSNVKLHYFQEQMSLLNHYKQSNDSAGRRAYSETFHNLISSFEDKDLRSIFSGQDLQKYVHALNYSIYHNRTTRLTSNKNLDKDQYSNYTAIDENILKDALLKVHDILLTGELKEIVNIDTLRFYFNSMNQFQLWGQSIDTWEQGVNDNDVGQLFLHDKVLGVVLEMAYKAKRFSYEEILRVYELNTKDSRDVDPFLHCCMGKIAVAAHDYNKGLDLLEELLKVQETATHKARDNVSRYLADIHLVFIGSCKDIAISKHFFDKVINYDLPYSVKLKVSHVASLLQNCYDAKEPFDTILYFWKSTINYYVTDPKIMPINSRFAILNNTLFKIFFDVYPELNSESFGKLKEVIDIYNNIKSIDELFINTLISNYNWKDKVVFQQIIDNYEIFNVKRTQVSNRVVLKKMGEIKDYTNEEILDKWYETIKSLDSKDFRYIAMADWASIRDATIFSAVPEQRTQLYWDIVSVYRNYFQDDGNCLRFIKNWQKNKFGLQSLQDHVYLRSNSPVSVVSTRTLKPHANFDKVFKSYMDFLDKRHR